VSEQTLLRGLSLSDRIQPFEAFCRHKRFTGELKGCWIPGRQSSIPPRGSRGFLGPPDYMEEDYPEEEEPQEEGGEDDTEEAWDMTVVSPMHWAIARRPWPWNEG
jgi:hypothetical protein